MQVFRGDVGLQLEAGNLPEGVDAGIGAAGALGQRGFAGDAAEGGLQLALDGWFSGLNLPAAVIGAVVGKGELPGLRAADGLGAFGHWLPVQISEYSKRLRRKGAERGVGYTQLSACRAAIRWKNPENAGVAGIGGNEPGSQRVGRWESADRVCGENVLANDNNASGAALRTS